MEHDFTGFAPAKSPTHTSAKEKSCSSAARLNREHDIQNSIRAGVADIALIFRANVGSFTIIDGRKQDACAVAPEAAHGRAATEGNRRHFDTGLPKGFSDLFGFRIPDGRAFFIEVKSPTGKVRPEQQNFIERMRSNGALAGVARSVEDARKIIMED